MSSSLDSAKNAVKSFLSKDGKHDTTVHEGTAPAVTEETVNKHRHENVIQATDKEVHQDHYHTTVQPVHDTQKLPEKHHYNAVPVEHRQFEHGNDADVKSRLESERAKFKDTTVEGETKHTSSAGAKLHGEHIHHHVHENIQPVVQRQTIEPHVVHTTVPVHEVHHSAAQHHATTSLPAVSMDEFKQHGGALGGGKHHTNFFEGEPRSATGHTPHQPGDASGEFRNTGHHDRHGGAVASNTTREPTATTTGLTGSHHTGSGLTSGHAGSAVGSNAAANSSNVGQHHTGTVGSNDHASGTTSQTAHSTTKPSLVDRLNPMKDSDHDGKKGFMD